LSFEPDKDRIIHMTDSIWEELVRRYRALTEKRRIEREREKEEAAKPTPRYCSFCREPTTSKRMFWGDENWSLLICETCVATAAASFAEHRGGST
jgi:hypothetical protein